MRNISKYFALGIVIIVYILFTRSYYEEPFEENGNIYVFYHVYCNDKTLDIVKVQLDKIIESGLHENAKAIYCFLVGEEVFIGPVKEYIEGLPDKFIVKDIGVNDKSYERFTLTKISENIGDNDKFLYFHSKGVTQSDPAKLENIRLWRDYMEYQLIKRHRECIDKLNTNDIVGVAYMDMWIGPHFSGNFWWSTGAYYKRLVGSHQIGPDYYDVEKYIFMANPKHFVIDNTVSGNTDLYSIKVLPEQYIR
jgi:hypothetical protein